MLQLGDGMSQTPLAMPDPVEDLIAILRMKIKKPISIQEIGLEGGEGWCALIDDWYEDHDAICGEGETIKEAVVNLLKAVNTEPNT